MHMTRSCIQLKKVRFRYFTRWLISMCLLLQLYQTIILSYSLKYHMHVQSLLFYMPLVKQNRQTILYRTTASGNYIGLYFLLKT
ncbi:hypothetical protein EDC94DRAFT_606696 [Helicostylum pulchrum]|nr:hypothetical protein EDC94DRAFT_606696 [Helicostylum pulchrum]